MNLTSVPKRGYDSWVDANAIHKTHGSHDWMQLCADGSAAGGKYGYLWMPHPARMKGRTIASAILTGHAHGSTVAQTLEFAPADAKWAASTITWNNQPGVTGTSVVVAVPALTDGQEFTVELRDLVQQIADGTIKNHGWRITTNAVTPQKFAQFDSGETAWTLTVEFSEDPEAPTALAPNGTVVSVAKPVVTFDFTEYGTTATDLASVRVEVDLTGDGVADWDSGWVAAVTPSLDLAAAGMTGVIAAGDDVFWRAYVQDQDGRSSTPSDWAVYTYQPLGTGSWISPSGSTLFDPTSELIAQLDGQTLGAWRMWVTDGDDRTSVRYDTGKRKATDPSQAAFQLPLRDEDGWSGTPIFLDDSSYQLHARLFDTYDRQGCPGAPSHVDIWKTITFDDDLALAAVTTFTAVQLNSGPFVELTWTDSEAGDAYVISRDGVHIARLAQADLTGDNVAGYTYLDMGAAPGVNHTYKVRRITTGVGRSVSRSASITINVEGIWLVRPNGDYVVLDDVGVDQLTIPEMRLRYAPINRRHAVDIITQYAGITGPISASIEDADDQTATQARNVLDAIKNHPTEAVQLIYATVNKPVLVSQMTVLPDPEYREDQNRYRVNFYVDQVGDFDYEPRG